MDVNSVCTITKLQLQDIDIENDWKVITLWIGGNDLCDFCNDEVKI